MKKLIITSILALSLLVGTVCSVAAAATALSIGDVTVTNAVDESGRPDGSEVTVSMEFTAPAESDQITIVLASENIESVNESTVGTIIYIDQVNTPASGSFTFDVSKARIREILGKNNINGCTLYLKLGASASETSVTKEFTFNDPAPYGDANDDERTNSIDLAYFQRYIANWENYTEETVNLGVLDLNGNGSVDTIDAIILARHLAKWIGYETLPVLD